MDFQTFSHTYYNDDGWRIYQVGLRWICRGIIQMILYRLIYRFLLIDPTHIKCAGPWFRHIE